jgi:hypothetical protein
MVYCTFRDLERVVAHLFEHGLVGRATHGADPATERFPEAPEYAALVMPAGAETLLTEQAWWDAARTRRIYYPQILKADLVSRVFESATAGEEIASRIDAAEAWSYGVRPVFAILDKEGRKAFHWSPPESPQQSDALGRSLRLVHCSCGHQVPMRNDDEHLDEPCVPCLAFPRKTSWICRIRDHASCPGRLGIGELGECGCFCHAAKS